MVAKVQRDVVHYVKEGKDVDLAGSDILEGLDKGRKRWEHEVQNRHRHFVREKKTLEKTVSVKR